MVGEESSNGEVLARLSTAEREVLLLLAQGHTAKTISVHLGISLAAVNERLRSARRRTGAGSSRKLARQFSQINRHDFLELPQAASPRTSRDQPSSFGRWLTPRNIMLSAAALTIAAFIGLTQLNVQAPPQPNSDQDVVARLSTGRNPAEWRQILAAQARDDVWASGKEAALRERYGATPAVARSVNSLSVNCASSLCEVIGRTRPGATNADTFEVVESVQSGDLSEQALRLGLTTRMSAFTADPANSNGTAFVVYLERTS